jgi:hypothetical protein
MSLLGPVPGTPAAGGTPPPQPPAPPVTVVAAAAAGGGAAATGNGTGRASGSPPSPTRSPVRPAPAAAEPGTPLTAPASVRAFGPPPQADLSWERAYALAARAVRSADAVVQTFTKPTRMPLGVLPPDAGPEARATFAEALAAVRARAFGPAAPASGRLDGSA